MANDLSTWLEVRTLVIDNSPSPERAGGLLKAAQIENIDDQSITLAFPNALMKAGADRSYIDLIKDAFFALTGVDMEVITIVKQDIVIEELQPQIEEKLNEELIQPVTFSLSQPNETTVVTSHPASSFQDREETSYTKTMTFETFVRGDSNELAYSAAVAVAENPGIRYNPLFIYGRSGLGKTHLLSAINNYVTSFFPTKTAHYFQAKELTKDLADATMTQNWVLFDAKYTNSDIILIDDIQFFQGKKESIERFFQILNDFIDMGRQVVISADRSPRQMDMDERMISRFLKGLPVDIQPPTFEMKYNIIKQFITRRMPKVPIDDDVISYVAEISGSNIREIEGALHKLESFYSFSGREISIDTAQQILRDFFPDKNSRTITIAMVQKEVERFFGITHEEMISGKRERRLNVPRQIAMYLCHELTSESYPSIGRKFGNRDHSTIIHGVSKVENELRSGGEGSRDLYDKVETLRQNIKEKA